jgi:hypothetical protein
MSLSLFDLTPELAAVRAAREARFQAMVDDRAWTPEKVTPELRPGRSWTACWRTAPTSR